MTIELHLFRFWNTLPDPDTCETRYDDRFDAHAQCNVAETAIEGLAGYTRDNAQVDSSLLLVSE